MKWKHTSGTSEKQAQPQPLLQPWGPQREEAGTRATGGLEDHHLLGPPPWPMESLGPKSAPNGAPPPWPPPAGGQQAVSLCVHRRPRCTDDEGTPATWVLLTPDTEREEPDTATPSGRGARGTGPEGSTTAVFPSSPGRGLFGEAGPQGRWGGQCDPPFPGPDLPPPMEAPQRTETSSEAPELAAC